MKTSLLFSARTWGALVFTLLLSTACQKEESLVKPAVTAPAAVKSDNLLIRCLRPVYIATFRFNARRIGSNCYYSPGRICIRFIRILWLRCWLEPDFFERIKPDPCLSCPDEIVKLLPDDIIPDFRQQLDEKLPIDPKENVVLFPITTGVIGLQAYAESETLNKRGFTLKEEIVLSEEEQKGLGVAGKVIPAGEYPVVFNERNNTYNAIVGLR